MVLCSTVACRIPLNSRGFAAVAPNHLGLWPLSLPRREMALITSDLQSSGWRAVRWSRSRTRLRHRRTSSTVGRNPGPGGATIFNRSALIHPGQWMLHASPEASLMDCPRSRRGKPFQETALIQRCQSDCTHPPPGGGRLPGRSEPFAINRLLPYKPKVGAMHSGAGVT